METAGWEASLSAKRLRNPRPCASKVFFLTELILDDLSGHFNNCFRRYLG